MRVALVHDYLNQRGGAERVFAMLDTPPDWQDAPSAVELPAVSGRVEFRDVAFGYDPERLVLHDLNFVPHFDEINVDYDEGTAFNVTMHDGSKLMLRKLEHDYDPTDKGEAIQRMMRSHAAGEVLTGVLYLNTTAPNFLDMINMTDQPLATLPETVTRPSREVLEQCMEELR